MMDVDLKEQISDLKSLLRTVANALERHLRCAGLAADADRVRAAYTKHHQYRTERQEKISAVARDVINRASDYSGGPHVETLERLVGWHLPGRKKAEAVSDEENAE